MPQNFISRYNNLLAVKGLGSIEYTAGPNIDISDYIISGRDWSSDIDSAIKGVKGSGFSAATAWVDSQGYLTAHQDVSDLPYVQNSALEFYGVHISGISGSGLYALSAEGAFTAETANFAYHSETSDSADYAESANVANSAMSAYTAQFANSANSALISEIANYAYTAEVANNLGNWNYTDSGNSAIKGVGGTGFVAQDLENWDYTDSAHTAIKGYNGTAFNLGNENCPWISGNKVIGAVTADFGNTLQVISSFDFSGNKNHYISLKGFNLTLPSTGNIASALDAKFDTSSFNNFISAGFNPNMTELHGATAYISAFANTGVVHNSALESTPGGLISGISGSGLYATSAENAFTAETAYYAENAGYVGEGWEYNADNEITGYSGSAFAQSEGDTTPWISGDKIIDPEILLDFGDAVQMISSFNVSGYKNHAIALKGRQLKLPSTAHIQSALDEKLDTSAHDSYTAAIETIISGLHDDDNYLSGQINNKADISAVSSFSSDISFLSGATDYISGVVDTVSGNAFTKESADTLYYPLTGNPSGFITGVDLSDYANSGDVTGTGQYALTTGGWTEVTAEGGAEYSAGQYIKISGNEISVTGLQPAGSYQPAGNYVTHVNSYGGDNQSAGWKTTYGLGEFVAYTTGTALPYILLSGRSYTDSAYIKIDSDGVHIHSANPNYMDPDIDIIYGKYTAGPNISINASNGISGKDWTDTITAASAYAASMATGKEYTGVAPIVVNNAEDKISANTMELIAGNGIEFVTAATSTTINCTGGGGAMNVTDGTSSYSALGFYDQGNDPGCFQIMGTAVDGTTPGRSFGYTLPMQARTFSADCVASAENYTDAEISAHIKYVSYGALAAGTVTFADVRSAIVDGGIVIPYEVKAPGSAYLVYNYTRSGIANSITGYDFTRYDAGGNCVTLTVSSQNDGATTGCVTALERVFATPSDVAAVDRIVLVAASGDIPASGATDSKVYIVTGS